VIWYQGESDVYDAALYRKLFPAMITAWRNGWRQGNFPFFYVQLPGFLARRAQPAESRWAELREAQTLALGLPKTGMAVTIDTSEEHNIHPADKQDVGHRLALIAKNQVYGKSAVAFFGPVFAGMQIEDGKAILSFTHEEGGGLAARDGPPLTGFAIAGADRKFAWADAEIRGDKVIVHSKDVPSPVAVRYAWADTPAGSLINKAHLPASPFRTDNWVAGEVSASPAPSASPTKSRHRRHAAAAEPVN
jgi:sialate O-acetylesterase